LTSSVILSSSLDPNSPYSPLTICLKSSEVRRAFTFTRVKLLPLTRLVLAHHGNLLVDLKDLGLQLL
jgi:hypothetical protein